MDIGAVLGPGGLVAKRLPSFEERPQQVRMAERIGAALEAGRHLLAEAGTGVGKSFAYLVPAILRASDEGEKVVVATHTIALQEQLITKDVPFLSGILPREFSVVVAKGRANYLCRRRLLATIEEERAMFELLSDVEELRRIEKWSDETHDGTVQDLDFAPRDEVWSRVNAEAGNCLGRHCEHYRTCHFQTARRRLQNANVVIANHSLLFSDLSLRQEGSSLLPKYDILVLDEAHEVESVAADHLGLRITSAGVRRLLRTLVGRRGRGLLAAAEADDETRAQVAIARDAADSLFDAVRDWAETRAPRNLRVMQENIVPEQASDELGRLAELLLRCASDAGSKGPDAKSKGMEVELSARAMHCSEYARGVRAFLAQELPGQVYWVDLPREGRVVELHSAPIRVGEPLNELLFRDGPTVILTSATLTIGRGASFGFLRDRLGLVDADEESFGSPFEFFRQVKIHLPRGMPDPRSGTGFEEAVAREVVRAALRTDGRAFVLFTSYRMLEHVHAATREELESRGYRVLRQGGGMPRYRLLEVFREDVTSILFGTDSFWQGVDVPGEALSHVVITKLPFEVPDRPIVEARLAEIEARGGNAFMEYSLPKAVLRLKQGFGRLIRTREDRGAVTILDPRVTTKRYGRLFVESLPECEVVRG